MPPSIKGRSNIVNFPYLVSLLGVLSPAGIFLSAPYAESPFAALIFLAHLLQAHAVRAHVLHQRVRRDVYFLSSGVVGGIATTFRSNGTLNILVYLHLVPLIAIEAPSKFHRMRYLFVLGISCLLTALGSIIPQALAWVEYCHGRSHVSTTGKLPPSCIAEGRNPIGSCFQETKTVLGRTMWCEKAVPSIYAYVQSHYWNVGFLRYWTLSNVPLFLLAAPVLSLMAISAWKTVLPVRSIVAYAFEERKRIHGFPDRRSSHEKYGIPKTPNYQAVPAGYPSSQQQQQQQQHQEGESEEIRAMRMLLSAIALPQLVLTAAAFVVYHVQIITRLSSAHPVMYWYLARLILDDTHITVSWPPWRWQGVSRDTESTDKKHKDQSGSAGRETTRSEASAAAAATSNEHESIDKASKQASKSGNTITGDSERQTKINIGAVVVRGWICYAMVQAGLFGAFLPPA